jgi:pimeloyl-ACP methyl ester carboxylesterase
MSELHVPVRRRWQRIAGAAAAAAVATLGTWSGVSAAQAEASSQRPSAAERGWAGIVRETVSIEMGNGWTSKGELTYPRGAGRHLPVVVLLHGSGHNDMNETLAEGGDKGSVFVPVTQAINRQGYAVLRFNKRGVLDVGPILTDDPAQLSPPQPYQQILSDAAAVVRFAARSPRVDPSRILLFGHSEGTQVASNLAADPARTGIPKPAGVITMGVVGSEVPELITYQIFGVRLAQLREEFDVNGDGTLTYRESVDGLIGQPENLAGLYREVLLSGATVNRQTDRNGDGKLDIDAEIAPVFRKTTRIDNYPDVEGITPEIRSYLLDIARFNTVTEDLPRYDGPTLLLNGENDIQTPARSAIVADAAIAAAGHKDHTLHLYPGLSHTMSLASKFSGELGEPDPLVLKDLAYWLADRR